MKSFLVPLLSMLYPFAPENKIQENEKKIVSLAHYVLELDNYLLANIVYNQKSAFEVFGRMGSTCKTMKKKFDEVFKHYFQKLSKEKKEEIFFTAIQANNLSLTNALLLLSDVDINCCFSNQYSPEGHTPLTLSTLKGFHHMVELLVSHPKIDVNKRGRKTSTPLAIAAEYGKHIIANHLLSHDNINANEPTPLHKAVIWGHELLLYELLRHPKIDVNHKNQYGESAFFWVLHGCKRNLVQGFLNHKKFILQNLEVSAIERESKDHTRILELIQEVRNWQQQQRNKLKKEKPPRLIMY